MFEISHNQKKMQSLSILLLEYCKDHHTKVFLPTTCASHVMQLPLSVLPFWTEWPLTCVWDSRSRVTMWSVQPQVREIQVHFKTQFWLIFLIICYIHKLFRRRHKLLTQYVHSNRVEYNATRAMSNHTGLALSTMPISHRKIFVSFTSFIMPLF